MSHPIEDGSVECKEPRSRTKSFAINFNLKLKSLTRWMRLIGLPLPSVSDSTNQFVSIVRAIVFSLVLLTHVCIIILTCLNAKMISAAYVSGISTTAASWNFIIDTFNFAMYVIGGHAFLLFLTRPKTWKALTNSFKLLDDSADTVNIYKKCRRFTFYSIIYVIFSVTCLEFLTLLDVFSDENTSIRVWLDIPGMLSKTFPATALAMFCIFTRLVTLHLRAIRNRIKQQFIRCHPSNVTLLESQRLLLKSLKKKHVLVCKAIRQLNRYFGIFLMVEVCFTFLGFINCSMYVLMGAIGNEGVFGALNAAVMIDQLLHLIFLTFVTDDINSETEKTYEALTELAYHQPFLQNEISLFSEQLFHRSLQINALGFFKVSKQLFPSLVGTTLTYFLILLQFHSAEKQ